MLVVGSDDRPLPIAGAPDVADLGMPGVSQPEDPRQKKKRRVDLPMSVAKLYSEEGAALVKFVGTFESVATTAKQQIADSSTRTGEAPDRALAHYSMTTKHRLQMLEKWTVQPGMLAEVQASSTSSLGKWHRGVEWAGVAEAAGGASSGSLPAKTPLQSALRPKAGKKKEDGDRDANAEEGSKEGTKS